MTKRIGRDFCPGPSLQVELPGIEPAADFAVTCGNGERGCPQHNNLPTLG
jgi:hypothetical protein